MKKDDKNQIIDSLVNDLTNSKNFYITDIGGFDVLTTGNLRRTCFKKDIKLKVVKNTLLRRALEKSQINAEPIYPLLTGYTSIMFSDDVNTTAKLIKEFRRTNKKPILKGAYVQECFYVGDDQLDILTKVKTKNELIADVIALLQAPAKNVISALQSGGNNLAGIIKTLSEKSE